MIYISAFSKGKTVAIRRVQRKRSFLAGCGGISSQLRKQVIQIRFGERIATALPCQQYINKFTGIWSTRTCVNS